MLKKILLIILTVLVIACAFFYLGMTGLLYSRQDEMIFPSAPLLKDAKLLSIYKISFTTPDKHRLDGWLHPGENTSQKKLLNHPCHLLIYYGGQGEEVSGSFMDTASSFYFPQLYVNYRGSGTSTGRLTGSLFRKDALFLFDQITQKKQIAPNKVCLVGRSLGSHAAAFVASRRPVSRLVLISPFDRVDHIAKRLHPLFPVASLINDPLNTLDFASQNKALTLFVLTQFDDYVPHQYTENLIKHWHAPYQKVTLPNKKHSSTLFSKKDKDNLQLLINFLTKPDPKISF